jgi:hypothetical protein
MQYFEDSHPPTNAEIGCKMPFMDGHLGFPDGFEDILGQGK